jgi:hypothetical protein
METKIVETEEETPPQSVEWIEKKSVSDISSGLFLLSSCVTLLFVSVDVTKYRNNKKIEKERIRLISLELRRRMRNGRHLLHNNQLCF